MAVDDYDHGVLVCLSQLTEVGQVSREMFVERFNHWKSHPETYHPFVMISEDSTPDHCSYKVIGTGMLMVEKKLIHSCGHVGHIEDIVIHSDYRGNNLGKLLIDHLTELAQSLGCYKVILDCSDKNKEFYTKCGYIVKGIQMSKYFV